MPQKKYRIEYLPIADRDLQKKERGKMQITERAEVMTDNQWDGIIKLVYLLLRKSKSKEEAMKELKLLMRDREKFEQELEKEGTEG
jgi:hypothetical protein